MNRKKLNGSFYTPKIVADFIAEYLSGCFSQNQLLTILEPSAGDGVFVKSFLNHPRLTRQTKKIVAVERNKTELNKVEVPGKEKFVEKHHSDFLLFQKSVRRKFQIVVGNPPYIKKNHLKEKQIRLIKEIHQKAELANHEPKNIWTAFLVRCIDFTDLNNGVLAFILPAEILQVKFAAELRQLLHKNFQRVEYLNFQELIFEAEGQKTALVIAYRSSESPGIYFGTINKLEDLSKRNFTLNKNDLIHTVSTKEIHHNISSDDLQFLNHLRNRLKNISSYCTSKPGIVTAANDFFIVNKQERREYALSKYTKPIIQRGAFVNGKVEFDESDWKSLSENDFPCYLLDLNNKKISRNDFKLRSYLKLGEKQEIHKRYKCSIRDKWYNVPNIAPPAEALFFKRCHHYPKLLKNGASAYVTDSAYMVNAMDGFLINHIIFSFYNSMTLLFAELEGRYYGGGVLELTPSEFKNLPLPYVEINENEFFSFSKEFVRKTDITNVLDRNDLKILNSTLGLTETDILRLRQIHNTLLLTRLRVPKSKCSVASQSD